MNPPPMFCPYRDCPSHQQPEADRIVGHGQKEPRGYSRVCQRAFSLRKGTPFYRWRTPKAIVTQMLTWLAHGCPVPAIVAAFGLNERTVASRRQRAGEHCRQVHEATVQ